MSVQVKTPTKTQFERLEIQRESQGDGGRKCKDDSHVNAKFSQPWNRKRRYSMSYRREDSGSSLRRKRIKSAYFEKPLPMRFLNGGSIDDPLNLNGLDSTELGRQLNSVTPQSSPLPTPKHQSVTVRRPVNVTDPLNLNETSETITPKSTKKKRHRHRHKKKDNESNVGKVLFSPPKNVAKDKNLMEALRIDIEPEIHSSASTPKDNVIPQKPRVVSDKIVSPVIRQTTLKHKKRRRTNSEGKPEPSAATSRSLLTSSSSTSSPKKFKQPKQQSSKGKGGKSMQGGQQKFIYGNYNRYYGYRNPAMEPDHRINSFSKHWFEGKCVLDIGCNVGHLTLAVAEKFSPAKVVGMDIDHKLVAAARKNIRYYISTMAKESIKFPISNVLNYGPIEAQPIRQTGQMAFPHNVMFVQGNFVLEHDELLDIQREEHDVIMALSITKWIHFNWGDDGLKRFFKRIYKQLRPGGMFILEPQPWSSYKKKKKLTDTIFKNFQSIHLRPEQFTDYLLSKEVGFSTCKTVDVPMNKSKGFRRPILVFRKSETVQNSPLSESGSITPPRTSGSLLFPEPSEASERMSDYSSCSTCSTCSSCCSETPRQRDVDEEIVTEQEGQVKTGVQDQEGNATNLEDQEGNATNLEDQEGNARDLEDQEENSRDLENQEGNARDLSKEKDLVREGKTKIDSVEEGGESTSRNVPEPDAREADGDTMDTKVESDNGDQEVGSEPQTASRITAKETSDTLKQL